MKLDVQLPDVALVVLSCDKYSDLWSSFFRLFFHYWPNCNFPIYLCANRNKFDDSRVTTVLSGYDHDWSSSLKKCLDQINHEYVWLFFDDVFLNKQVNLNKISRLIKFLKERKPNYLRFRRFPKPEREIEKHFGECLEGSLYRTSIFAIWKKETLINLLLKGETAWDFENKSIERARSLPGFFGVYEDYLSYIHGVEKGLWIRPAVKCLQQLGCNLDLSRRSQMTSSQHISYVLRCFKVFFFDRTPSRLKPALLKLSNFFSKNIFGAT